MRKETERLVLREFTPEDFEDVHAYASDYETVKHMMFGPNTEEQTRAYLEKQCREEREAEPRMHYNLAIQRRDNGRVIGGVSFHMNWRRDDAILGAVLNRHETGRGYMTEAMRGVLDLAFDDLKLHRIHAVCDVDNEAILHVLDKCAMRREGRMVRRGKARPEAPEPYFDQYGYAILREEWLQLRENRNRREKG